MLWNLEYGASLCSKAALLASLPYLSSLTEVQISEKLVRTSVAGGAVVHSLLYRWRMLELRVGNLNSWSCFFQYDFNSVFMIERAQIIRNTSFRENDVHGFGSTISSNSCQEEVVALSRDIIWTGAVEASEAESFFSTIPLLYDTEQFRRTTCRGRAAGCRIRIIPVWASEPELRGSVFKLWLCSTIYGSFNLCCLDDYWGEPDFANPNYVSYRTSVKNDVYRIENESRAF